MNYAQLKRRVARAEHLVEGRSLQTSRHWSALKQAWREGWTPARIVAAGLVAGFVTGRAEPLQALTGPRLLQMISAVSGLFASAQASFATEPATDNTEPAAATAQAATATGPHAADATEATPAPPEVRPPRPAEAATELSES